MINPISFRLNAEEIEMLESLKKPDESLSLCAARLLREKLQVKGVEKNLQEELFSTDLETTVNNIVNKNVDSHIEKCKQYVDKMFTSINERLEALETKPKPRTSRNSKTV